MASPNLIYRPVQAFVDSHHDRPGPRCGHTLTRIFTSDGPVLVLFGGTTITAKNNSLSEINVQGVTNNVHCFYVLKRKWKRLNTYGHVPSPRALHAAASLNTLVLVQGGIGRSGLCDPDVYMLNIAELMWKKVIVDQGIPPNPRYGHVMGIAARRWLIILGGRDDSGTFRETWALDLKQRPLTWSILRPNGNQPHERSFASACVREDGVFVIFGGTNRMGELLGDAYGLRIDSITQCQWTRFESVAPRFHHKAVFEGSKMHVVGGRTVDHLVDGEAIVAVLETTTGQWLEKNRQVTSVTANIMQYQHILMKRCLHAAATIGNHIYVYGGLGYNVMLDDFLVCVSNQPTNSEPQIEFWRNESSKEVAEEIRLPSVEEAFYKNHETDGCLPFQ